MNENNYNNFNTVNNNIGEVPPIVPTPVVPTISSGTNNSSEETSKNNKNVKLIVLILIFIVAFGLGILVGMSLKSQNKCAEDDASQDGNNSAVNNTTETYTFNKFDPKTVSVSAANNEVLTTNIKIGQIFFNPNYIDYGKTRDAYIYGKNNNQKPVHVDVVISYFDKEGYQIEKYTSKTYVSANQEFVIGLNSIIKDDTFYNSYKITYLATDIKSYETNIDINKYELTSNDTTTGVVAVVKSNADKEAYANITCLYYKQGKVVFADARSYLSIKPNESQNVTFYTLQLRLNVDYKNPKSIEYDEVKVFLSGAYNSDTTNY